MPYCKRCGARLVEEARFCPSCGSPVSEVEPRRRERRLSGVRILLFVFGGIVLLVAFGLFVAGGALFWVNTSITDSEGFITTRSRELRTDSHAIAFQHVNISMFDMGGGVGGWRPSPRDFLTIKMTCSSSKRVFVGVAKASDMQAYLSNVKYEEVTRFSFSPSLTLSVDYITHQGTAAPADPTVQGFWAARKYGSGTQTLAWEPEAGDYWIVLMNEDGSSGLDMTMGFGAKIPILSTIGLALLAAAVFALTLGAVMVFFGLRK